jgi:hypothetical protein
VSKAQALLKKQGCYPVEPASNRFDAKTQDAVGRFQRGAHLDVDPTHLTTDFMQKLAAYDGEAACPTAAPPPPPVATAPPEAPRPNVEQRPVVRREPPREPKQTIRLRRSPEAVQSAEESAPTRHPAAPAARPQPAPPPSSGGAKPQIFIPN